MPYAIVRRDREWCVVKKVDPGGKSFGCHPTRPKAVAQMQAIIINEHKAMSDDELADALKELNMPEDCLDCTDVSLPEGDYLIGDDLDALFPGYKEEKEKEGGIPGPENRMANIPKQMLAGLCKKIGKEPGFYTRCVTHKFGGKITDVKSFCTDLHKSCTGKFPTEGEHPKRKGLDEKAMSLDQLSNSVRQAWNAQHATPDGGMVSVQSGWVKDVYLDHIIVEQEGKTLSYPYNRTGDGYSFGDPTEVVVEYVPAMIGLKEWFEGKVSELKSFVGNMLEKHPGASDTHSNAAHSDKTKQCPECDKWVVPTKDGKCPECGADMSAKSLGDSFLVTKDRETGQYQWFAVYTNKYRDRDNPPEIIASAAHEEFVKALESKEWPMPELWPWHIEAPVGVADVVTFDRNTGFMLAAGHYYPGMDVVAEASLGKEWKNSHGMPVPEIRRDDPADKTIITRYRTKEITYLPPRVAANELTGFDILKEGVDMKLSDEKARQRLTEMFGEERVAAVEDALTQRAKAAGDAGVESKDRKETPTTSEVALELNKEEFPTRQEVFDALAPLKAALDKVAEQLENLSGDVKGLKGGAVEKERDRQERTPRASLYELVYNSVTKGAGEEDKVKGKLTGDLRGPKEAPRKEKAREHTGIPFVDAVIEGGDWREAMNAKQET